MVSFHRPLCAAALSIGACNEAPAAIIRVPQDQPTIQSALLVAMTGDEIVVSPGTYATGNAIFFGGRRVTVRSTDPADAAVVAATVVGDLIEFATGEDADSALAGLTLRNLVYCSAASPDISDCQFDRAAIRNELASAPRIMRCVFTGTDAAITNTQQSAPAVIDCRVIGRIGMHNINASPRVVNCLFAGSALVSKQPGPVFQGGAVVNVEGSSPVFINCAFIANVVQGWGGAIHTRSSSPSFINCTFYANIASATGGALHNEADSLVTLVNCILDGNIDESDDPATSQIVDVGGGQTIVSRSIVHGGWTGKGGDNVDADPLFVDPAGADGLLGTVDDHVRLLPHSPAIDHGLDAAVPTDTLDLDDDRDMRESTPLDLDGAPRFRNAAVDAGAAESDYCAADGDGSGAVDVTDLLMLLASWGDCSSPCPLDTNADDVINVTDLLRVLSDWGACP